MSQLYSEMMKRLRAGAKEPADYEAVGRCDAYSRLCPQIDLLREQVKQLTIQRDQLKEILLNK